MGLLGNSSCHDVLGNQPENNSHAIAALLQQHARVMDPKLETHLKQKYVSCHFKHFPAHKYVVSAILSSSQQGWLPGALSAFASLENLCV